MTSSTMLENTQITAAEEARYAEIQQLALNAARTGDSNVILPMLDAGLPLSLADEKGNSLLMLASYHGHHALTKSLLEYGVDPDQRNDRRQTALAGVAFKGGLEIAKLLVQHGADPRAVQGGGQLPEQFAAMFGNPEIVDFLQSLQPNRWKRSRTLWALSKITGFVRRRFHSRNQAPA